MRPQTIESRGAPPFRALTAQDLENVSPAGRLAMRLTTWTPPEWKPIRVAPLDYTPWAKPGQIVRDSFGGYCEVVDD
jgi:hypothetical protein